jgi:hypothetical protein
MVEPVIDASLAPVVYGNGTASGGSDSESAGHRHWPFGRG